MSNVQVQTADEFLRTSANNYKTREEVLKAGAEACGCKEATIYKKLSSLGLLYKFPLATGKASKFTQCRKQGDKPVRKFTKRRSFNRKKGLDGFIESFDKSVIIPTAIEEGIAKFLVTSEGEPDWMWDEEFRDKCKISVTNWRRYANEFAELQVKVDGKIVWGHPDIIEEMKEVTTR